MSRSVVMESEFRPSQLELRLLFRSHLLLLRMIPSGTIFQSLPAVRLIFRSQAVSQLVIPCLPTFPSRRPKTRLVFPLVLGLMIPARPIFQSRPKIRLMVPFQRVFRMMVRTLPVHLAKALLSLSRRQKIRRGEEGEGMSPHKLHRCCLS